jgi:CHAD domain-containing protein
MQPSVARGSIDMWSQTPKSSVMAADPFTIADGVRQFVPSRLEPIASLLERAAFESKVDFEHIHALRVKSRRAEAALRLFAGVVPQKHGRWFSRQLRKIRRAAGKARDLDVLLCDSETDTRAGAEAWRRDLERRRVGAQRPIDRLARKLLKRNRLTRHGERLEDSLRELGSPFDLPYEPWFQRRTARIFAAFETASQNWQSSLKKTHRLRIRAKALRYGMELAPEGLAHRLNQGFYGQFEVLQEHLGLVNDSRVALEILQRARHRSLRPERRRYLDQRWCEEMHRLDQRLSDFAGWWAQHRSGLLADGAALFRSKNGQNA